MRKHRMELVSAMALALALGVSARAEFRLEKALKLDPGGRFVLESDVGSVTVTGSAESGAHVVITSDREDVTTHLSFSFEDGPGTARVTAHKLHHFDWPRHLSVHYEVRVPNRTALDIKTGGGGIQVFGTQGDADLRTSGGGLEVSGLAGQLSAHTSGGHISLREVTGNARVETSGGGIEVDALSGSLHGQTSGGPIRVKRVDGEVRVDTSGGSIHIEEVAGRVVARTSGGPVSVNFGRGNDRGGELETSGGSIHVRLDPSVNLDLDASTSGGHVKTSLPLKVVGRISGSGLHGSLGSGGEMLRMHTSGGSIEIDAL